MCLCFSVSKGRKFFPSMMFKSVARQQFKHPLVRTVTRLDSDCPVSHESLLLSPRQTKKNGALVFCCTAISMPHSYLKVRYDTHISRKIMMQFILYQYPLEEMNLESSIW